MKNIFLTILFFMFSYLTFSQGFIIRQASLSNMDKSGKLNRKSLDGNGTDVISSSWHRVGKDDAEAFWGDTSDIIKPVQFSLGQGINGQIYTDLISSRIEKCKLTLGGTLSNSNDSTSGKINNFINGGGNAILKAAFPLSTIQNSNTPNLINATLLFIPRIAANLPKLSKSEKIGDWNLDIGVELHGVAAGKDGNLGIIGKIRTAYTVGSQSFSSAFLEKGNDFVYVQLSAGILIKKDFIISVNIKPLISGKKTDNFNDTFYSNIGIQVLL
jgi:hypothetical protein